MKRGQISLPFFYIPLADHTQHGGKRRISQHGNRLYLVISTTSPRQCFACVGDEKNRANPAFINPLKQAYLLILVTT